MNMDCFIFFMIVLFFDLVISRPIFIVQPPPDATEVVAAAPVSSPFPAPEAAVFKPSIAVIVAVLTTMFSVTFLLLLYAKHWKRGDGVVGYFSEAADLARAASATTSAAVSAARSSGIDRAVVESLPVFRFGSLSGEKEGLECAVCLNRFDPVEVLRLLPKCKHAFHVECVDTWLDAHSTCPLCRCRVDPEDVLLVDSNHHNPINIESFEIENPKGSVSARKSFADPIRRISGRHSHAGVSSSTSHPPPRRSCDGPHRKSEAAASITVAVGCFDRHRKDGMLMTAADKEAAAHRRLDHRIVIAGDQRWSDAHAADLLYLKRDSVMNEGRLSSASSAFKSVAGGGGVRAQRRVENGGDGFDGRVVNNGRSVSEITGVSRRLVLNDQERQRQERERRDGAVSRWMAWISQSRPGVRSREEEESEEEGSTNMKVILIRQPR